MRRPSRVRTILVDLTKHDAGATIQKQIQEWGWTIDIWSTMPGLLPRTRLHLILPTTTLLTASTYGAHGGRSVASFPPGNGLSADTEAC